MFLFDIYFHFFLDMFRHLHAILNGVNSNYIKLYRALTRDSYKTSKILHFLKSHV
jgi:hypothetical protein